MKKTEIIFIIDNSGSMHHLTNDTIGGFNGFLKSQQALEDKATLTTVLFNTSWKLLHDGKDIREVEPITTKDYVASGGTAMLDAIGDIINQVQDRHDELGKDKPDQTLVVITTDGEENSSTKFKKAQIEKMIKHQTDGHGWQFIFLGANMDAVQEAQSIGIQADYASNYTYTAQGYSDSFNAINTATCSYRCAGVIDECWADGLDTTSTTTVL